MSIDNLVYREYRKKKSMEKRVINFKPQDVPKIKKIVNLLNEKFKKHQNSNAFHHDDTPMKLFIGFFPRADLAGKIKMWHICCGSIWVYDNVKMKAMQKIIKRKYPELKLIFACVWALGIFGMVKDKEGVIIK